MRVQPHRCTYFIRCFARAIHKPCNAVDYIDEFLKKIYHQNADDTQTTYGTRNIRMEMTNESITQCAEMRTFSWPHQK